MKIKINGYIIPNEYKEVYGWFGIAATCPADITAVLDGAKGKAIDVEIGTCYGGDVFAGSEIYTALKAYKGDVNITITGIAASAASIIAMAGHCEMSPTAQMMVHNAQSYAEGDYHDMDQSSGVLQSINKSLASAYMLKSGMDEKAALALMDKESWLTAQQALDKKLIDGVMFAESGMRLAASVSGMGLPQSVIDKTLTMLAEKAQEPEAIPKEPGAGEQTAQANKEEPQEPAEPPASAEPAEPTASPAAAGPENKLASTVDKMKLALLAQM